jgi:hypothetical protein
MGLFTGLFHCNDSTDFAAFEQSPFDKVAFITLKPILAVIDNNSSGWCRFKGSPEQSITGMHQRVPIAYRLADIKLVVGPFQP